MQILVHSVHPHGCGERIAQFSRVFAGDGSSPRVWGTRAIQNDWRQIIRFIPTGVGNAWPSFKFICEDTVHPHGCGERENSQPQPGNIAGSSPRVWGTHNNRTPATLHPAVHPHGCGERKMQTEGKEMDSGSSPRVWGTPTSLESTPSRCRFIPTGVGNALSYGRISRP